MFFDSWDLYYSPLRLTLRNHQFLQNVLTNIFTNQRHNYCPNVQHIIWMTMPPYPQCFTDQYVCYNWRGMRHDTLVSSMNQFNLNYFHNLFNNNNNQKLLKKLSIIDSYDIIHPLGIFEDNNECNGHYSCIPNHAEVYDHTVSGDAVLSILLLTLLNNMKNK